MNIYHIGKWALTNYVLLFVIVGCFSSDMVKIWWIFLPYTCMVDAYIHHISVCNYVDIISRHIIIIILMLIN